MTTGPRSTIPAFVLAGISLVLAVVAGVAWLGQPLRMVNLVTIIGLSMTAGVSWSQALRRR
jgi:multidrug transporter EmrE-like cation transporter